MITHTNPFINLTKISKIIKSSSNLHATHTVAYLGLSQVYNLFHALSA